MIATQVSTVTDGLVRYRGTSVLDLVAAGEPFEAVAARLIALLPREASASAKPVAPQSGARVAMDVRFIIFVALNVFGAH